MRYTPAGIPVLSIELEHESKQQAGGFERAVRCVISAQMVGTEAPQTAPQLEGNTVCVDGFLAAKSLRNPRLVLHVQHVELIKV